MTRTRASAKAAGTAFETLIARHLAQVHDDDRVERRTKTGAKDRGDIAGVRVHGQRLASDGARAQQELDRSRHVVGADQVLAGVHAL